MTTDAAPVTVTAVCEAGRHWLCLGTIVSLLAPVGAQCQCSCHADDDLAIEARLETERFGADPVGY